VVRTGVIHIEVIQIEVIHTAVIQVEPIRIEVIKIVVYRITVLQSEVLQFKSMSNCSVTNLILADPNLTLPDNAGSTGWAQVRAIRACLSRLGQNGRIAPSFLGLRQDMWSPKAFMLNRMNEM